MSPAEEAAIRYKNSRDAVVRRIASMVDMSAAANCDEGLLKSISVKDVLDEQEYIRGAKAVRL